MSGDEPLLRLRLLTADGVASPLKINPDNNSLAP